MIRSDDGYGALLTAADRVLAEFPADELENMSVLRDAWKDGTLRFQVCVRCGFRRFPPAARCPECLGAAAHWQPDTGEGRVWSACTYHHAWHQGFAHAVPYPVAMVELESGPQFVVGIMDIGIEPPIGARVTVEPRRTPAGHVLAFARVEA